MKIQREERRMVKPTAPSSSKFVELSSSDLIVPGHHVPILYAFAAPAPSPAVLEQGLAKVLSDYPEFAGRLIHNCNNNNNCASSNDRDVVRRPAVILNDEGAIWMEAEAHGSLLDLWPFKPSKLLLQLIPPHSHAPELLLVQITRFHCGGITIGIARHHYVADGESACQFMNAWASIVKGLPIPILPTHDRSILFITPPLHKVIQTDVFPSENKVESLEISMQTLHFSVDLLTKIKEEARKGAPEGVVFSTFISLMAHLWKCITKARNLKNLKNEHGETKGLVAMNIRNNKKLSLPMGYFGNAICHVCPNVIIAELICKPLSFVANIIHESLKNVDLNEALALDYHGIAGKPHITVSSWVKFPLYNLNFGSGNPIFVGMPYVPTEGLMIFTSSPKRDGSIDVVLGLYPSDMEKLESICFDLED